ncbi:AraC family transcriptional regulator [Pseudomonas vranovensis]|uniref:AraC family transcriptional regulator n=1 Tax=Pseudomonas vranovensis TaxID=321661 RepID=UPI003D99ED16
MRRKNTSLLDVDGLPAPIYFRQAEFEAGGQTDDHQHAWGSLDYAAIGVMHYKIEGQDLISPPQYAVWIPPNTGHSFHNAKAIVYRSVYLAQEYCERLPLTPQILVISDIIKSILNDFAKRDVSTPDSEEDIRLAQVLIDQLCQAKVHQCYLPTTSHSGLLKILNFMREDPGNNFLLSEWAERLHVSERTLARHFVRELGMSFGEWRLRLRFLAAVDALETGRTVQEIAFDMGYTTASAFIAMFQRQGGLTPEQYRRRMLT